MKIEVLYFDGCPNVEPTMERLKGVLVESGTNNSIFLTRVSVQASAQALRFLGSPTIRINEVDIEPSAASRTDYGLMCRAYSGSGGVPSEAMIRSAISVVTPS